MNMFKLILSSLIVISLLLFSYFGNCESDLSLNSKFNDWTKILNSIPKQTFYSDAFFKKTWISPSGDPITVKVRGPEFNKANHQITVSKLDAELDATPLFNAILKRALHEKVSRIKVEPGTYHFYTLSDSSVFPSKGLAHIYLEGLKNFEFDGGGSTFVFHNNKPGFLIQHCQKVKVQNLSLKFATGDKSIGELVNIKGRKLIKVNDSDKTLKSKDLFQVIELNQDGTRFITNGMRFVFAPGAIAPATYHEGGMFYHELFNKLSEGSKFLLIHYWYGAQAIKIDGDRTIDETEDIILDSLNIYSTPGMAITTTGLKRGLAVVNSTFGRADGNLDIVESPSWDALNVHNGGGDFYIENNNFYFTTDDAINIYTPIHKIDNIDLERKSLVLKVSSRFINVGDFIAFFDEEGQFYIQSKVLYKSKDLGDGVFEFRFDSLPLEINKDWVVRDINLVQGRYYIANNTFQFISGHAILAQTINGLIEHNQINNITRNPIRLLSSVGTWREGVGVFNVIVKKNYMENTGVDWDGNVPWAAISLYGIKNKHQLSNTLINDSVVISDNLIINPIQGCITISNTQNSTISRNICKLKEDKSSFLQNKVNIIRSINVKSEN